MHEKNKHHYKHLYCSFYLCIYWTRVYTVWDFKTHPELYVVQSAPWYTSILIYGVLTIILLLICIVIKVIINHKSKQK